MIHVLSIHNIIRHSQKKMIDKYIFYIYFILEQTCRNRCSFCIFKDELKKKYFLIDAERFLGDEKQVINLEWPKERQAVYKKFKSTYLSQLLLRSIFYCVFNILRVEYHL